ncbi:MAG: acyltransferase family protein [Actinobacteria bacterium]|nr:acyltransferase family protein [Actinomycetota bacterium]
MPESLRRHFISNIPRVGVPPGRDLAVDALRGFAILLVVLGHSIAVATDLRGADPKTLMFSIHRFIYLFHMPLLFLISGYVLFGKKLRPWDRAMRLLVPFFAWLPLYYLMNRYLLGWQVPFTEVLKNLFKSPLIAPGPLWFLPTLFLCSVALIPAAFLKSEFKWPEEATLAATLVVLNLIRLNVLGFMQVKYFFLFFAVGYLAAKYRRTLDGLHKKHVNAGLAAISALFLFGFTGLFYMGRLDPSAFPVTLWMLFSDPLGWIIRYSMAFLGIAFSIALVRALKTPVARKTLAWFGLVTMDIYVVHGITIRATFGTTGWVGLLISFLCGVFLSLAVSLLLLRQSEVTAMLFLGIRPRARTSSGVAPVTSAPSMPVGAMALDEEGTGIDGDGAEGSGRHFEPDDEPTLW